MKEFPDGRDSLMEGIPIIRDPVPRMRLTGAFELPHDDGLAVAPRAAGGAHHHEKKMRVLGLGAWAAGRMAGRELSSLES